jgi:hypothetical protein
MSLFQDQLKQFGREHPEVVPKNNQEMERLIDIHKSHPRAVNRYFAGIKYKCSTGIDESITRGYGKLDDYGFWEYPLHFQD